MTTLIATPKIEYGWDGRESFSKVNPKLQLCWDSTSLGALKKCPRYYQLSIVEGWRRTRGGSNVHFRFGILYHRALEVYDHKRAEGMDHEDALRFAVRDLADGCMDWEECEPCKGKGELPAEGKDAHGQIPFAPCAACEGRGKINPTLWDPNEGLSEEKAEKNNKTIYTLFRSVVWYLERFGTKDPIQTITLSNGKPAVELSFRFDAGFRTRSTDEEVMMSGHLDRVGRFVQAPHVVDRKTSSSTLGQYYFDQFNPHNQMTLYSVAGRIVADAQLKGVVIDAAQIAKGFTAFQRGITTRTDGQLTEWLTDFRYWVGQAEYFAAQNYWPMNDTSCNDFGGCVFRGICSKDPKVREHYLKSDFHVEKWDPLKVRGEI